MSVSSLTSSLPVSITNLRAHYADGQVWIVWTPSTNASAQQNGVMTWDIYSSETDFTDINNARHIAKMFDEDCKPQMLIEVSNNLSKFRIPDGNGGYIPVREEDRLFVKTVRSTGTNFYTVTDGHHTNVIEISKVAENYSLNEPPKPHLQGQEGLANKQFQASYFYLWVDGDRNLEAGRPDFEIMASEYRTGCPHLFITYAKNDHDFTTPAPMTVALHGGKGFPSLWDPSNSKVKQINVYPDSQFTLAHADRINILKVGHQVEWKEQGWFGYRPAYNPFIIGNPDATNDEVIVNYSQKRILWINEWMIRIGAVERNQISICGYSGGSTGALRLSIAYPHIWSSVTLFCQGFRSYGSDNKSSLHGSHAQNLRTNLIGNHGDRIRWKELSDYTQRVEPMGEYPLVRVLCGINDNHEKMHWEDLSRGTIPVYSRYQQMDAQPFGFHLYWDERAHLWSTWDKGVNKPNKSHWCRKDNQTQRDDFSYQTRYRNDVSFPGFFNHQAYSTQDPTQDKWGTWGGYFEWDGIVDESDTWQCSMWLISTVPSSYAVDESPFEELHCDLIIRRIQNFMTTPQETIYWKTEADGQIQTGQITTTDTGKIIFTNIRVNKEYKTRLFLSKTPF